MAFDRLFCPIKSSKSKKSPHLNNRPNEAAQNTANSNTTNSINSQHSTTSRNNPDAGPQATSSPYRYVTREFHALADDELNVFPGDLVLYEFTDSTTGGDWSHVSCFKTHKRGFVPSEILSTDPRKAAPCKKKMPRSIPDSIEHHLHSHMPYPTGMQPSSDGENMKFQQHSLRDTQSKFNIQSLQGTLHKYHDYRHFRHLSPPAYYNVRASGPEYERYEVNYRPFHRENLGLHVVLFHYVGREEGDLDVDSGDYVTVLNKEDDDWYWARRMIDGKEGFVPAKFVCDYKQVESILSKGNSTVTMKSSNHNEFHTYINHRPERESLPTDQQSSLLHPI